MANAPSGITALERLMIVGSVEQILRASEISSGEDDGI